MIETMIEKYQKELLGLRKEWKHASLARKKVIQERASIIKAALNVFDKILKKRDGKTNS